MKNIVIHTFILLTTGFLSTVLNAQGIAINPGGADPHPSAMLDVDANNKGFLPPRLSTVQRDAIVAPANGLLIYNTTTNCLNTFDGTGWRDDCGSPTYPLISSLDCASATNTGTLTSGTAASVVSSSVPYTGGNGGPYSAQSINSTGVTGLTAILSAGTLASGAGSLTYTITGTPSAAGTADFALSIGGQSCSLSWTVNSLWSPGYVNCVSQATVIVDVTNPATGKTWMDRNLGAIQAGTSFNDPDSYGDLYQWGRMADGHQCRTSPATNSTSNGDQPGHGNWIKVSGDWRSPSNDNLWQGVNGINNPCPSGYRLPTEAELADELATWIGTNWSGNKTSAAAFGSPLKWTGSGHRDGNNNFIYFTGIRGTVWSSTISGTNARGLLFDDCQISCTGMGTTSRSTGFSVRCIKN